jgi:Cu-Zn family superoxide dismutase
MTGWRLSALAMACVLGSAAPILAAELRAEIKQATPAGTGDTLGTVTVSDSAGGAAIKTALKGLPPGPHGFHIHENGSCQPTTANGQPVPARLAATSIRNMPESTKARRATGISATCRYCRSGRTATPHRA